MLAPAVAKHEKRVNRGNKTTVHLGPCVHPSARDLRIRRKHAQAL